MPRLHPQAPMPTVRDTASHVNCTPELLWGSVGTVVIGIGLLVVLLVPPVLHVLPGCLFQSATGVPCPTCGGIRAAVALAHGDPLRAVAWNPLAALAVLGLAVYLPYAWLTLAGVVRPIRTGWLSPPMPVWLRWTLVVLLATNWIYLVAVGR